MTWTTLAWSGGPDGRLRLLDQTRIPSEITEVEVSTVENLLDAIRRLVVRGAPAIGVAAAFGPLLSWQAGMDADDDPDLMLERIRQDCELLRSARPTAVNLHWALSSMLACVDRLADEDRPTRAWGEQLLSAARAIEAREAECCLAMARHGNELLRDGMRVLTHCNSGRLATSGVGTALGVLIEGAKSGKRIAVTHTETRPLLQGARLTAFELRSADVECEVVLDAAAPSRIAAGAIDAVFVGADRITRRGDVANKIGTYPLALAAHANGIPFYVVAPLSTLDLACADGKDIVIEERSPDEVLEPLGEQIPANHRVRNPAFDVTPRELVTAIVCERGVLRPPFEESIKGAVDEVR